MSLYKRGNVWWILITHSGQRIQQTTGTPDRKLAQQFHDQLKATLWKNEHLPVKETIKKTWKEAVIRWFSEMQHKRSLRDDHRYVRWLDKHFGNCNLADITKSMIDEIASKREAEKVSPASINRTLAFVRAILRKAANEWEWIERVPSVRMRKEDNKRIRWISQDEAKHLLSLLPPHLAAMTAFSLATGLRQSNVCGLKWQDINMAKKHTLVHPDQAKAKKAIPVPLNEDAIEILKGQLGKHHEFVFSYRGNPIIQTNTKAWRNALKKAEIKNFRWHDLRHTWASWHIQNGTTLQELQVLGGWSCMDMVLRYAHLSSDHLQNAAERISMRKTG